MWFGESKGREFLFPLCGLVFYLSVVKHHKFTSLKHVFIIMHLWWLKGPGGFATSPAQDQVYNPVAARLCSHLKR